jgi:NAD(P)-dependent dehydrogenase (short-subunit alcohol dehydrogenase family)
MRLQGKVAIVTGAGSGIGRATAQLFAKEGAEVVVGDFNADLGRETVQLITSAEGEARFVQVDVSDFNQVRHLVEATLSAYGGIDILFNGAGVLAFGTALDTDEKTWNQVLSVNLTGTFLCCKAVLPEMIKRGGGSIINVSSSTGAHDARGNTLAYVASKGGVTLLTKAMAIDHARVNVRVNALAPGPTDTPMLRSVLSPAEIEEFLATFPIGRLGRPEELANAALFLASDESSFVTGSIIAVDGDQTAEV